MRTRNKWILSILLLTLSGLAWAYLRNGSPTPPEFATEEVRVANLMETISSTGTIQAVGTVEVGSQVSGTVAKVLADYNDKVRENQTLVVLDQSTLQASMEEAEAQKAKAEAQLERSRSDFERIQKLYAQGHVAEKELTDARTTFLMDQASVKSADASLRRSRESLSHATIRSPIRGTVLKRSVEVGQTVAASLSSPTLFVIAEDLSKLEILAGVDESDISQIFPEQEVRFSVQAYPDSLFQGRVRQVRLQPESVQNVVTYQVVVDASNPSGILLPGMTATVDFVVDKAESALCVPSTALRYHPSAFPKRDQDEDRKTVWVLEKDGLVKPRFVETGIIDGDQTEIRKAKGLKAGDRIVTGEKSAEGKSTRKKSGIMGFGAPAMRPPR